MERLALVARLRPDASARAAELVAAGPPFDPAAIGLSRHDVYVAHDVVVFLFEGDQVEWAVEELVDDPFRSPSFQAWAELLDGPPRLASEAYHWEAS